MHVLHSCSVGRYCSWYAEGWSVPVFKSTFTSIHFIQVYLLTKLSGLKFWWKIEHCNWNCNISSTLWFTLSIKKTILVCSSILWYHLKSDLLFIHGETLAKITYFFLFSAYGSHFQKRKPIGRLVFSLGWQSPKTNFYSEFLGCW